MVTFTTDLILYFFTTLQWLPSPLPKGAYILILTIRPYTGAARATLYNLKSWAAHTSSVTKSIWLISVPNTNDNKNAVQVILILTLTSRTMLKLQFV